MPKPPSKAARADAHLIAGHVHPYRIRENPRGVRARVEGEHGTYDVAAWYDEREAHPVRCDCSHALAVARLL